ncbi:lipid IV(A) 3-deoxy-D-manno-octulosonic acid transferase [Kushneria aurantia]|uniref:3-deoxy-D-manno-octulosonic acid transferase n=1 Tax=Kushneria aurantia TaxID=504092 RepID=A0ABV6G1Z9_9GAMM|nr:lipid IV(A) 3-deoxy-D-manno-octulosonic acid transferase [Kushneria aurantia]
MSRKLYSALLYLLAPLIWRRVRRERMTGRPRGERLGHIADMAGERVLWLHAASLGEVMTARPLIRALIDDYPEHRVVITTMTVTGAERVNALFGDLVTHFFIPLDFPGATRRFVERLAPEIAIIVETELWPNLIHACSLQGVPVTVVNARITERGFRRYRRFAGLMVPVIRQLSWVGAKSGEDAQRFRALGVPARRINVTGALKFDLQLDAQSVAAGRQLREAFGDRPVWVAGSTHEGEESQLLRAHATLRQRFPDALLVLVPRHPQRFDEVDALCRRQGLEVARRSAGDTVGATTAVYLGDTLGELMALYGAGDIAFVGGSLVDIGGHNLLEPAALGRAVISGPSLSSLGDVLDMLEKGRARLEARDADELGRTLVALIGDDDRRTELGEQARAVVAANRGALGHTRSYLAKLILAQELDRPLPEE